MDKLGRKFAVCMVFLVIVFCFSFFASAIISGNIIYLNNGDLVNNNNNSFQLNHTIQSFDNVVDSTKIDVSPVVNAGKPAYYKKYSAATIKKAERKVNEINAEIKKKGAKWTAGVTDVYLQYTENPSKFIRNNTYYTDADLKKMRESVSNSSLNSFSSASVSDLPSLDSSFPSYFDWRQARFDGTEWISDENGLNWMTPVKYQGTCDSCYAYSSIGAVEAKFNIFNNNPNLNLDLSEKDIECSQNPSGSCTSGGSDGYALMHISRAEGGTVNETCLPDNFDNSGCDSICSGFVKRYTIYGDSSDYGIIDLTGLPDKTETYKTALKQYGPLVTGIESNPPYFLSDFLMYTGGIYSPLSGYDISHSVVLVGYDDTGDFSTSSWIVRDSQLVGVGYAKLSFDYIDSGQYAFAVNATDDVCVDRDVDGVNETSRYDSTKGELYCGNQIDCDDNNPAASVTVSGYADVDGDGYGAGDLETFCTDGNLPIGYVGNHDDCNDADNSVWQNLIGYVDSDGDGFGVEPSMNICSGTNLPLGYSAISGDCNDIDPLVNPTACSANDGWYLNELVSRWAPYGLCKEINQTLDEHRVYICDSDLGDCSYSVDQTQWKNMPQTRIVSSCQNALVDYQFNESVGDFAIDSSNDFEDGTIVRATRILGRSGNAIYFNGINSYVNTNNIFSFNSSDKFSISLWFKPESITDNTERALFSKSYPNFDYLIYQKGKRITFRIYMNNGVNNIDAYFDLNDTKWHHIVGVYNGFNSLVYLDGVAMPLHYGNSSNAIFMNRFTSLLIGTGITWQGRTGTFKGAIDEFKIYNRNISLDEIINLNNSVPAQYCGDSVCGGIENYTNCFYDCPNLEKSWAYYSFNETGGINANDSSGIYNGTIYGNANRILGLSGNAIYFNGVNNYVNTKYTFPLNSSSNKISISLWFKPDADTFNELICNGINNSNTCKERAIISRGYPSTPYTLFQNGKLLKWAINANPYGYIATADISGLNDGKWHYLTAVFDGATAIIYIDGVRKSSSVFITGMNPASGTSNVALGYGMTWQGRAGYFKGMIDEVKIYNRVLFPDEIVSLNNSIPAQYCGDGVCNSIAGENYTSCVSDCYRNPILFYSFNESSGNSIVDLTGKYNGSISSASMRISSGKKGNALFFNGSNYANSSSIDLSGQNQISVSMWVSDMSLSSGPALVLGGYWFSTVQITPLNSWTGFYAGNTGFGVSQNLNDGKWHQLIITYTNGSSKGIAKSYIDGVLKMTYPTSSKNLIVNSNERLVLGKRWPWNDMPYRGAVDEVRVYNVTLSDAEVSQMFGSGM